MAAFAVVAVSAGCGLSATGDPAADTDVVGRTEPGGQARDLTDAEQLLIQQAEQSLIKQCMEQAGFTYLVGRLPTVDDLKGGGYVLTDVAWAKRHGYGSRLRQKLAEAQADDPNHAYARALPRQERVRYGKALDGELSRDMLTAELPSGGTVRTPRRSCLATAQGQLYGDHETWFRVSQTAMNLTSLYAPDLVKDRRFVDAVAKWSACMGEAGHEHADPPEAREKLAELTAALGSEAAYAIEVELAVAEATCATRTPLARTARALQTEYRDTRLRRYGDETAAYRRMSLDALGRAEDITGATA
ncbi:hypothetical protein ACFQ8C_35850 [Streptomyces sp. NPDC056503]|uniref:hypothetical protein n=1 Tax=Streptomyces sp. NPDC056503 TaxID=3345842 RepID=UPI00368B881A